MKKLLAVLVATAMIGIIAIPVLASPFSDLPEESHWALDALTMLAALGIVEGYPDGSFKGTQPATRYEVALIVARALEYLDKDIRQMSEKMFDLEGRLDAGVVQQEAKPVVEPEPEAEPVLQPSASPDATILEQVIYEKIAAMSDEQWVNFEEKLYELVARVDDLSEDNKAEHAKLWEAVEALEALKEARTTTVVVSEGADIGLALDSQKAEIMKALSDAVNAEKDERQKAIDVLGASMDAALSEQKGEIMMALYDSLEAAKDEGSREMAELEAKLQLALDEQNAALTMAFYDSLKAAAEGDEQALQGLSGAWQLALDEYNAELTMAFYDSLKASKEETDRAIEDVLAKLDVALAEQNAELTMAFYDSIEAAKDEQDRKMAAMEAELQLALDEQNAELMMAFYDSIRAAQNDNAADLEALKAELQLALDEQNAELMMAFYDSIEAAKDEQDRKMAAMEAEWQLALDERNAELMMAFYDSIRAAQNDNAADLEALKAEWQLALDEQNAELMMAFYDSIQAQREDIMAMFEDTESRFELALDELRAELMMAFYDSVEAEADERARAIDELAEDFDLKLMELHAEVAMETYDSVFAAREECLAAVDAVVATIDALQAEFSRELAALNLRVDAVERELAVVRGMADQNAKDIAETYHRIKTEDIAPLEERVAKLEGKAAEHDEKISGIWDDLNRFRFTGTNTAQFTDIDLRGEGFYQDPWNPAGKTYAPTSVLQNKLELELNIVPEKGVSIDVGLSAVTDIFGKDDSEVGLFDGGLNLDVTTPSGNAKVLAGDLARPRNFTKYQISRKVFGDAGVEGLSLDLTTGPFVTTGMIAKIEPAEYEMQYVLGGGASYTLGSLKVDGRLLKITDDPESGLEAVTPNESVAGTGFALKLGEGWKLDGEISSWNKDNEATGLLARNLHAAGKAGVLNLTGYFEQVDDGYAPKYLGTASNDPDRVVADTRKAGFEVKTDSLNGLTITGSIDRAGDAWYASKDVVTYATDAEYEMELGPIDVTLRGGVAKDHNGYPTVNNPRFATTTDLGFDVAFSPLKAGFTWEHEVEANATSYIGYADLNMPLAADTLALKGNWKQSFGSNEYYTYGLGIDMKMPITENVSTMGGTMSYGKSSGMARDKDNYARFLVGADLEWKLRPATTFTGKASYELRDYEKDTQPSGEYLQYGLALSHEIYKSTTLKMNYDFKDVYYSPRNNELTNYSARIIGLSLKTVF
ncbi:MAG: S-layer homology domain-containing protein [Bacillota bacterium]